MAVLKTLALIVYGFFAWVAISFPLTIGAQFCIGVALALAVVNLLQAWFYRALCKEVPGTTAIHLFGVCVFGIFHLLKMRQVRREIIMQRIRTRSEIV